jgi:hypothetical protein
VTPRAAFANSSTRHACTRSQRKRLPDLGSSLPEHRPAAANQACPRRQVRQVVRLSLVRVRLCVADRGSPREQQVGDPPDVPHRHARGLRTAKFSGPNRVLCEPRRRGANNGRHGAHRLTRISAGRLVTFGARLQQWQRHVVAQHLPGEPVARAPPPRPGFRRLLLRTRHRSRG